MLLFVSSLYFLFNSLKSLYNYVHFLAFALSIPSKSAILLYNLAIYSPSLLLWDELCLRRSYFWFLKFYYNIFISLFKVWLVFIQSSSLLVVYYSSFAVLAWISSSFYNPYFKEVHSLFKFWISSLNYLIKLPEDSFKLLFLLCYWVKLSDKKLI